VTKRGSNAVAPPANQLDPRWKPGSAITWKYRQLVCCSELIPLVSSIPWRSHNRQQA